MDIAELLTFSVKNGASDLHLSAGMPPMIRVDGDMRKVNGLFKYMPYTAVLALVDRDGIETLAAEVRSRLERVRDAVAA